MPTEDTSGKGQRMVGGSLLDVLAIDGNPTQDARPRPQAHTEAKGCPVTTLVRGGPSHHAKHQIDSMSIVQEQLHIGGRCKHHLGLMVTRN